MATTFVKRAGAPAGSIKVLSGGNSYTIDDASNTTITVSDATDVANLLVHPYLQISGAPTVTYAPPSPGQSSELGYSEATSDSGALSNTTYADIPGLTTIAFTVGVKPVYAELFIPLAQVGGATSVLGVRICNSDGSVQHVATDYFPGVALAEGPLRISRRFGTPGQYVIKSQSKVTASNYSFKVATGSYGAYYLRAFEV